MMAEYTVTVAVGKRKRTVKVEARDMVRAVDKAKALVTGRFNTGPNTSNVTKEDTDAATTE